jgi:hypothetical protein
MLVVRARSGGRCVVGACGTEGWFVARTAMRCDAASMFKGPLLGAASTVASDFGGSFSVARTDVRVGGGSGGVGALAGGVGALAGGVGALAGAFCVPAVAFAGRFFERPAAFASGVPERCALLRAAVAGFAARPLRLRGAVSEDASPPVACARSASSAFESGGGCLPLFTRLA